MLYLWLLYNLFSSQVLENEKLKKIGWGIGFFKGQSRESDNVRNSVRPLICGETRRKVNNIITQGFHKLNHEMGKAVSLTSYNTTASCKMAAANHNVNCF